MSERALRVRSLMFVPADRPDMIAKLPRFAPDVAVLDLEDAVAAAAKATARDTATQALLALPPLPSTTVLVRVNPVGSVWFPDDIAMVLGSTAAGVVLPKLEAVEQLAELRSALSARPDAIVIGGIESALGVADARSVVRDLSACYFGAEDYIGDLGGRRTIDGTEALYARSQVVLAARLAGVPPIDQAVVQVGDDERFDADARMGAALGYQGKICIHPRQVELAHAVFTPGDDAVRHALAVLAAGRDGVGVVDGAMVDEAHLRMARTTLARAGRTS